MVWVATSRQANAQQRLPLRFVDCHGKARPDGELASLEHERVETGVRACLPASLQLPTLPQGAPVAVSGWVLTDGHDLAPCAANGLHRATMSVNDVSGSCPCTCMHTPLGLSASIGLVQGACCVYSDCMQDQDQRLLTRCKLQRRRQTQT